MPEATQAPEGSSSSLLAPDEGIVIPRLKLGETGFVGLKTSAGQILEEKNRAFRYPAFLKTVDEMSANPTVTAAFNVYKLMLTRVQWAVESPSGATEQEKARAKFVEEVMGDMEHSWPSFINSVVPYLKYGFGISEKCFRRRLRANGSKYNDGLVGIRKLAPRAQDSIVRWNFSEDGRELLAVEQTLRNLENGYRYQNLANQHGNIEILREKFLLFSADSVNGNPEGTSLLKPIYLAFKQLTMLQDQQLLSVAKDVQGIMKIEIPPKYLDAAASESDLAVAQAFKDIIDGYNNGTNRGLLVPQLIDPESKLPLFSYSLLESKGGSKNNLESIIRGLQNDILIALSVDVLKLGSDGVGSFSLADAKTTMLAFAIQRRLQEIAEVLNSDLMVQLFQLNGWSTERMPKFVFKDVEEVSLEEASKYIQRVFSVGGMELDRGVMNRIREIGGFALKPDDEPLDTENLSTALAGKASDSGAGMEVGVTGGGTAKSPMGKKDNSASNADNKA